MTVNVTVRFFASMREAIGADEAVFRVPKGTTLAELTERILRRYPQLDGHQSSWHFAVNQVHAEPDATLRDGDIVAIFPYIAGG